MRYLDRLQPVALLALRLVLGAIMIDHGYRRVFGGLSHHVQVVSSLGLPGWLAYGFAAAEFFGGIALVVGLLTRLAALAILIDLAVASEKLMGKTAFRAPTDTNFLSPAPPWLSRSFFSEPGPSPSMRSPTRAPDRRRPSLADARLAASQFRAPCATLLASKTGRLGSAPVQSCVFRVAFSGSFHPLARGEP